MINFDFPSIEKEILKRWELVPEKEKPTLQDWFKAESLNKKDTWYTEEKEFIEAYQEYLKTGGLRTRVPPMIVRVFPAYTNIIEEVKQEAKEKLVW